MTLGKNILVPNQFRIFNNLDFSDFQSFFPQKVSPILAKIVSNDQLIYVLLESAQLFWLFETILIKIGLSPLDFEL